MKSEAFLQLFHRLVCNWVVITKSIETVFVHFLFIYFTGENANKETSTNPQRMLGLTF